MARGMSTRNQNEKKFGQWVELPDGGRRYRIDVAGHLGWQARYLNLNTEMESHAEAQGRRGEEVTKNKSPIFRVNGDFPPTLCGSASLREPLPLHFPFWVERSGCERKFPVDKGHRKV